MWQKQKMIPAVIVVCAACSQQSGTTANIPDSPRSSIKTSTVVTNSADAAFLQALHDHSMFGITSSQGSEGLIRSGHAVCTFLASGASMALASNELALHHSNNMSQDDADFFVRTAVTAYCPQYLG